MATAPSRRETELVIQGRTWSTLLWPGYGLFPMWPPLGWMLNKERDYQRDGMIGTRLVRINGVREIP